MRKVLFPVFIVFLGGVVGVFTIFLLQSNVFQFVRLPIPIDSTGVKSAGISYLLSGTVKEILKDGNNYRLSLSDSNSQTKSFTILETTPVTRMVGRESHPLRVINITPGKHVLLNAYYDLQTKDWNVIRISLPEDKTPPSGQNSPQP